MSQSNRTTSKKEPLPRVIQLNLLGPNNILVEIAPDSQSYSITQSDQDKSIDMKIKDIATDLIINWFDKKKM
jgi:hypothetical protein